jgi:prepilin-type N-terminal cleavage/methylation domain-containing protein
MAGFTLHELLIVLAIAVIVVVVALQRSAEPARSAAALANDLRAARTQAVLSGTFTPALGPCAPPTFARRPPRLDVAIPARGLAFDPHGRPRACDGSAVGNATILLHASGRQAAVVIASLGRVRWERR